MQTEGSNHAHTAACIAHAQAPAHRLAHCGMQPTKNYMAAYRPGVTHTQARACMSESKRRSDIGSVLTA
eukprot:1158508-Pelagomonas_calceolata.AAC.6